MTDQVAPPAKRLAEIVCIAFEFRQVLHFDAKALEILNYLPKGRDVTDPEKIACIQSLIERWPAQLQRKILALIEAVQKRINNSGRGQERPQCDAELARQKRYQQRVAWKSSDRRS